MTLLMLQQMHLPEGLSTLPSFIYKQVLNSDASVSQTYFNLALSWDHAVFLLCTLFLVSVIAILVKIAQASQI